MDQYLDKDSQIRILKKENEKLVQQNKELLDKLSSYTNPNRCKKWQEKNKESIKEYHKQYYLNKKTQGALKIEN